MLPTRRAYHKPQGDPCLRPDCGLPAARHLVDHIPRGEPCENCGLPLANHYKNRTGYDTHRERTYYVGLDGEGQGRDDHRYVMLAWSNEDKTRKARIEAEPGGHLSTVQCLDFLLGMPRLCRAFAYSFSYDLTKILADLPAESRYLLARPELRPRPNPEDRKKGPMPVRWRDYRLNLMGSKFTVTHKKQRRVVWDVFRFFQAKFTTALEDWKVGDPETLARMREMKDKRSEFDKLTRSEILDYCFTECAYMATLARKLTEAHERAGLHLRQYHGAGSTASCLLKGMNIQDEVRTGPKEMDEAVASAFFGGRFEHDVIGTIPGPLWGYDISSAYPYQITFLPCLGCGTWERTTDRAAINFAQAAIVRYSLPDTEAARKSHLLDHWGPFPFRLDNGAIAFPRCSGGGWLWSAEYIAGEKLYPNVVFREAWVYQTACKHRPFADIPRIYVERLRIGKEGPGIVLKLGSNACYGKLAQSLGIDPPFQCWIWAGMITAGTRAQIIEMLALHRDPANMLAVATDGIYTREKLATPTPRDTGTADAVDDKGELANKPLGGWERKLVEQGMFFARPGIYFPSNPTEQQLKAVRARGVGRGVMLANWKAMVDAYEAGEPEVRLPDVSRFHGMKSSVLVSRGPDGKPQYKEAALIVDGQIVPGRSRYGQWQSRPVALTFNPRPKRDEILPGGRLKVRAFYDEAESKPYKRTPMTLESLLKRLVSPEAWSLYQAEMEANEQPDGGDLSDYEES